MGASSQVTAPATADLYPTIMTPDLPWEESQHFSPCGDRNGDALIDEVRAIRADISAQAGNDVRRLCDRLHQIQIACAVQQSRRRPLPPPTLPLVEQVR